MRAHHPDIRQRVLPAFLCMLVTLLLPACQSAEQRAQERWEAFQRGRFEQRSEVLADTLDDILDEYLTRRARAGNTSDGEGGLTRERVREQVLDTVPGLLLATERMERAFSDGQFPNAENQRRVNRLLDRMRLLDVQLPELTQMLVDEHRHSTLRDARLEILRRLLEHHAERIDEQLWPE